jgi:hypothetical protein
MDCASPRFRWPRLTVDFRFDGFLCWTRIGGTDNREILHSMELISGLVFPRVRREAAGIGGLNARRPPSMMRLVFGKGLS